MLAASELFSVSPQQSTQRPEMYPKYPKAQQEPQVQSGVREYFDKPKAKEGTRDSTNASYMASSLLRLRQAT